MNKHSDNMPQIGFGTYLIPDDEAQAMVSAAMKIGYRHIDTAEGYGNESGIGEALKHAHANLNLKKEDIFQSVSMKDAIDQMEWAFRNLYRFSSKIPIRSHVNFNNTGSSLIMPGYIKDNPYFIVKIINISQIRKPSIIGIINVFDK